MLIENGKMPNEPLNASLGFWLPPNSPYGNFTSKFFKIITRLDQANRRISESYFFWKSFLEVGKSIEIQPHNFYDQHIMANEEVIYMLRIAADELISLIWCLSEYEKNGQYPNKIKVKCLGEVIYQDKNIRHEVFNPHIELMRILNDIANAYKHSFINSDLHLFGADEPRVHALGLAYGKLSSQPIFYDVSLAELIKKYNFFYKDCVDWLSSYSKRNR